MPGLLELTVEVLLSRGPEDQVMPLLTNQRVAMHLRECHPKFVRWFPLFWPSNSTSALPRIRSLHTLTNPTSTKL